MHVWLTKMESYKLYSHIYIYTYLCRTFPSFFSVRSLSHWLACFLDIDIQRFIEFSFFVLFVDIVNFHFQGTGLIWIDQIHWIQKIRRQMFQTAGS